MPSGLKLAAFEGHYLLLLLALQAKTRDESVDTRNQRWIFEVVNKNCI